MLSLVVFVVLLHGGAADRPEGDETHDEFMGAMTSSLVRHAVSPHNVGDELQNSADLGRDASAGSSWIQGGRLSAPKNPPAQVPQIQMKDELSILVLTFNGGEGEPTDGNDKIEESRKRLSEVLHKHICAEQKYDIIQMSSQEMRMSRDSNPEKLGPKANAKRLRTKLRYARKNTCKKNSWANPLEEFLTKQKCTHTYTYVGRQCISGFTKSMLLPVATTVEVAVRSDKKPKNPLGSLKLVDQKQPEKPLQFYSWPLKQTKGAPMLEIPVVDAHRKPFPLRLVGIHLDTSDALANLEKLGGNIASVSEDSSGYGVNIIAGDFNTRYMGPPKSNCDKLREEDYQRVFGAKTGPEQSDDDGDDKHPLLTSSRILTAGRRLLFGSLESAIASSGESHEQPPKFVVTIPEFPKFKAQDGKEYYMPTYKVDIECQSRDCYFLEPGCRGQDYHKKCMPFKCKAEDKETKTKFSVGVLDYFMVAHKEVDPIEIGENEEDVITTVSSEPLTAHRVGKLSDHLLVSGVVKVKRLKKRDDEDMQAVNDGSVRIESPV